MYPVVDTSPGAEGQWFPVRVCLNLCLAFTIACCGLISLMYHRIEGYTEFLHQFLVNTPCVCVLLLNRFQLQTKEFPLCFRFPVQNERWSSPGIPAKTTQVTSIYDDDISSTLCPLSYRFLHVCFSCHQTSVFTPAYGSVTNVRVNSSMTTGQVLNLLLHKFRVSSETLMMFQ